MPKRVVEYLPLFIKWKNVIDILLKLATETKLTRRSVREASADNNFPYFRFNAEFGRENSPERVCESIQQFQTALRNI